MKRNLKKLCLEFFLLSQKKNIYPPGFAPLKKQESVFNDSNTTEAGEDGHTIDKDKELQAQHQAWQQMSSAGRGTSRLEPRHGTDDWTALLGVCRIHIIFLIFSSIIIFYVFCDCHKELLMGRGECTCLL